MIVVTHSVVSVISSNAQLVHQQWLAREVVVSALTALATAMVKRFERLTSLWTRLCTI